MFAPETSISRDVFEELDMNYSMSRQSTLSAYSRRAEREKRAEAKRARAARAEAMRAKAEHAKWEATCGIFRTQITIRSADHDATPHVASEVNGPVTHRFT